MEKMKKEFYYSGKGITGDNKKKEFYKEPKAIDADGDIDMGIKLTLQDENGNIIYVKHNCGAETWTRYDDKGNLIFYKDSFGNFESNVYDCTGKLICKLLDGDIKINYLYDNKGNLVGKNVIRGKEYYELYDEE